MPKVKATTAPSKKPGKPNADTARPCDPLPEGCRRWSSPALTSASLWHHAQSGVVWKTETEQHVPPESSSKKKMSAYNTFMKEELPKYKAKHPDVEHKEAFKQVAILWKNSSQNPKK
ncbi:hypothetical protein BGX34_007213, partial [Mortierella sp. NVP85]